MTNDPRRSMVRRPGSSRGPAMNSVSVSAPRSRLSRARRGATRYQLIRKPPTVAGISQTAGRPHTNAAPLTPSRLQADEELAEALNLSQEQVTRRLSGSSKFKADDVIALARFLGKHWYYDIVRRFGVATDEITLDQAMELARQEGKDWDLVDRAA